MITQFSNKNPQISISKACKTLMLSHSTYYHFLSSKASHHNAKRRAITSETYNTLKKYKVSDTEVLHEIENILTQKFVMYGYKKTTAELKKRGYVINHKKVYRLMKEKNLLLKRTNNKNKKRDKEFSVCPTAPNQKWSIDIKMVKAANGDIGYVIAIKDCYTKEILSVCVERRHTAKEIENALYQALANRNLKEIPLDEIYIVSDNGKEIIKAMRALKYIGIKHCRITPESPWENGDIESFFSCLEREVIQRFEIEDFNHMRELISEYIEFYNSKRIHGGIGYKTPVEKYLEYIHSVKEVLANVA